VRPRSPIAAIACAVAVTAACSTRPAPAPNSGAPIEISVVATNDLHGHLDRLPILAGYLANLRARHPVVLVDAGDIFQGTMESSLREGATAIRAYDALGYVAAAIGNHDFDFGPVGPAVEPTGGADPRGALEARVAEARFPFLAANLYDAATVARIAWPNVRPSTLVTIGGVRIGIVGVATEEMPWVVRPSHFGGLRVESAAAAIEREAARLRSAGAQVVIAIAHAGGQCRQHDDPGDLTSCDLDGEIFRIARALPHGSVDILVGGHKHRAIAHRVNGIAVISAYSRGRAFGRVDVTLSPAGKVTDAHIHPPRDLCGPPDPIAPGTCIPGDYEGAPVVRDPAIAELIANDLDTARAIGDEPLGVELTEPLPRSQTAESPLGNLLVDLMMAARPGHDLALQNGGALRGDLPAGPLNYRALYEAMSFDNHFASVQVEAGALRRDLAEAFDTSEDVVSVSGARLAASCKNGAPEVRIYRADGSPIDDGEQLRVLTSDYLATGGDGLLHADTLRNAVVEFHGDVMIRDAMAAVLRKRKGTLSVADVFDPAAPRVSYSGVPPLRCAEAARR